MYGLVRAGSSETKNSDYSWGGKVAGAIVEMSRKIW